PDCFCSGTHSPYVLASRNALAWRLLAGLLRLCWCWSVCMTCCSHLSACGGPAHGWRSGVRVAVSIIAARCFLSWLLAVIAIAWRLSSCCVCDLFLTLSLPCAVHARGPTCDGQPTVRVTVSLLLSGALLLCCCPVFLSVLLSYR